jgi:hypothetical protein
MALGEELLNGSRRRAPKWLEVSIKFSPYHGLCDNDAWGWGTTSLSRDTSNDSSSYKLVRHPSYFRDVFCNRNLKLVIMLDYLCRSKKSVEAKKKIMQLVEAKIQ